MLTITVKNTDVLRDALFHAICLLDHSSPETDTDLRDVVAAQELKKLYGNLRSGQ